MQRATQLLRTAVGRVVVADCLELLPQLPAECVDVAFVDPPYFLQLPRKKLLRWRVRTEVESPEAEWDRFASFAAYDAFIAEVLAQIRRLLKPTGTVWVIGTYHNIHRIGAIMQDLGFWILNDVVWWKSNAMPNWLNVRMTNATEILIWAKRSKSDRGYFYDAAAAKQFSAEDFGARLALNVWRIPICSGRERLKGPDGRRLHPTQKPLRLLERVVRISLPPGGLLLDPMAGTGTAGLAAKRRGGRFVLVERDPAYAGVAAKRLGCGVVELSGGKARSVAAASE